MPARCPWSSWSRWRFVVTGAFSHLHRVRLIAGATRQQRAGQPPAATGRDSLRGGRGLRPARRGHSRTAAQRGHRKRPRQPAGTRQDQAAPALRPQRAPAPQPGQLVRQPAQPDLRHGDAGRRHRQRHPDLRTGKRAPGATGSASTTAPTWRTPRRSRRAITRRVAERRRHEQMAATQTATEKELTVAQLNLLHAQVEPHFLYNTLASAQVPHPQRAGPGRPDARPPHPVSAPLAAQHGRVAVLARRGAGAHPRLSGDPPHPHGRRDWRWKWMFPMPCAASRCRR